VGGVTASVLAATGAGSPAARRVPVGAKLALLAVVSAALFVLAGPVPVAVAAAATVAAYRAAAVPLRTLAGLARLLWPFLAAVVAFQAVAGDPLAGAVAAVRLLVLVALGTLVTLTTPWSATVAFVERVLAPLRPLGVDPAAVGLAVGLTLRFVPLLLLAVEQTRDAFRARGRRPRPAQLLFPVVLRAVLMARDVGEALAARTDR
jgi:biotin transport system permease protein